MRNSLKTLIATILTVPILLLLYLTMNNVNLILEGITPESIFYTIIFALLFFVIFLIVKAFIEEFDTEFNVDEFKNLLDSNGEYYEDMYHQEDLDEFT